MLLIKEWLRNLIELKINSNHKKNWIKKENEAFKVLIISMPQMIQIKWLNNTIILPYLIIDLWMMTCIIKPRQTTDIRNEWMMKVIASIIIWNWELRWVEKSIIFMMYQKTKILISKWAGKELIKNENKFLWKGRLVFGI